MAPGSTVSIGVEVRNSRVIDRLAKSMGRLDDQVDNVNESLEDMDGVFKDVNGRLRDAKGRFIGAGGSARSASRSFDGLTSKLKTLAATYVSISLAQKAFNASVSRIESERRIKALSGVYGEVDETLDAAARAAKRFGLSQTEANRSFAQIYARLRPIGVELAQIETAYSGFNTAARISGASAVEAESAWLQLSQALGSGVLRGEELNSVFEQTPSIVQAIANEMGVTIGSIRKLASEGKITSDVVLRALGRIEREGADQLASALDGPAQKMRNFQIAAEEVGIAITEDIVPSVTEAIGQIAIALENLTPLIKGTIGLFSDALGGFNALADRFSRSPAGTAKKRIEAGQLPGGLSGARELFSGTGPRGKGLEGLIEEAKDLSKLRSQPYTEVLLQLMQNRLKTMFPDKVTKKDATGAIASGTSESISGTGSGTGSGGGGNSDKIAKAVIGGLTGGAQTDASRGRSSGAHLHVQGNGDLEMLVSKALNFGGGRTASSFGISRGAAGHGYNAIDYLTPQGTPFTLNPGYTATDLGIRGALGRGMRVTGPGGSFELGHLAGVKMGGASDALSMEQSALNRFNQQEEERNRLTMERRQESEAARALAQQDLKLQQAGTELDRLKLEYQYEQQSIVDKYAEANKGITDNITIQNNEAAKLDELEASRLEYNKEIAKLQDEQKQLMAEMSKEAAQSPAFNPADNLAAIPARIQELNTSLMDTDSMILSLSSSIENQLASSMSNAITGLINGTTTVREAFANMLAGIGQSFIDMATRMLSQRLMMSVLGLFGGGAAPGVGGAFPLGGPAGGGLFGGGSLGVLGFAEGGDPPMGRASLVGENGPELIVPRSPSTVVPLDDAERFDQLGGFDNNPQQNEFKLETQVINGVEYATVDQVRAMGKRAAKQGQAMAYSGMRNNKSVRSRIGV